MTLRQLVRQYVAQAEAKGTPIPERPLLDLFADWAEENYFVAVSRKRA